jgi:hypothetical protein
VSEDPQPGDRFRTGPHGGTYGAGQWIAPGVEVTLLEWQPDPQRHAIVTVPSRWEDLGTRAKEIYMHEVNAITHWPVIAKQQAKWAVLKEDLLPLPTHSMTWAGFERE